MKSGLTDETIDKSGLYSVLYAKEYRRLANLPAHAYANVTALASVPAERAGAPSASAPLRD